MARQYQTVGAFVNETGTRQYQSVGGFRNETVSVASVIALLPASLTWTANDLTPVAGAPPGPVSIALLPASLTWTANSLTPVGGQPPPEPVTPPTNDCDYCDGQIESVGSAIVAAGYRLTPTLVGDCRRVRKG